MGEGEDKASSLSRSEVGFMANRRDILRTATGLAAAAVVGSAIAGNSPVTVAAGPNGRITGTIEGLGQFEVLAFSWGVSNSGSSHVGGGGGAGKANIQDLSFTKYTDALTPELFVATASGKHYSKASLTYADNKGTPIINLQMEDVLVTSLSLGGSSGESALTENVTLNFAKVTLSYGDASGGWDIPSNQRL